MKNEPLQQTPRTIFAETAAQAQFQRYVQRVAFNLTLSAPMIACLQWIRDDPGIGADNRPMTDNVTTIRGGHIYVTEVNALIRRGLVWHDEPNGPNKWPKGHKYQRLTRIGELTCELLVEAGMMAPRAKAISKRPNRKAA